MQRDFEGKAVIVTGSSSGIGQAIAVLLAKRGAMVTLTGRDQPRLKAAVEECRLAGGGDENRYTYVCGDIADKMVRKAIIDKTLEQFGRLDVLVCNHAVAIPKITINDVTEEDFDIIFNTNLKSTYFLTQIALPHLEKFRGNIVNVSTAATNCPGTTGLTYVMAKAGLDHLTKHLAVRLAPKCVRVNAINPSIIMTRIARCFDPKEQEKFAQIANLHPLHGRASTPEEQAEAAVFLASNAASYITGVCLLTDGAASHLWNIVKDATILHKL